MWWCVWWWKGCGNVFVFCVWLLFDLLVLVCILLCVVCVDCGLVDYGYFVY